MALGILGRHPGATALVLVGLAFGLGSLGAYRVATAEPIKVPTLPPVSEPRQDPTGGGLPLPALPVPAATPAAASDPPLLPVPVLPTAPAAPEVAPKPAASPAPGIPALPTSPTPAPQPLEVPGSLPAPSALPPLPTPAAAPTAPALPTPLLPSSSTEPKPALPEVTPISAPTLPLALPTVPPMAATPPAPVKPEVAPNPIKIGNETPAAPRPVPVFPEAKPNLPEPNPISLPNRVPATPATPKVVPEAPPPLPVQPLTPATPASPAKPDFNLRPTPSPDNLNGTAPTVPGSLEGPGTRPALPVPGLPGADFATSTSYAAGVAPMPLPTRQTVLSAVLGVALSMGTPVAKAQEPPKTADANKELKDQIESLKKELEAVKRLQNVLDDTVLGRKDGKVYVPSDKGLRQLLADLETTVKGMDERLKKLEANSEKITAGSSPLTGNPGATPLKAKGTLKLVNEYNTPVSLIVNGTSYPLDPQQVKDLEIPAGPFSYELVGTADAKRTSSIKDGETVTLRIR